ncbi:hypothetical protein [Archangium lipolyticum]|uniref:hypothetical protein n=1 Tax=Archangium lipolyticum TaxID=2970465 RepID=UPI002149DC8E|nr:hypothetical protein [Archangium lipolyticum]
MLTVFAWGYEGWGNSTRELLRAFDAVEQARGFQPPVFVDVRVRRQVRAVGFLDDAFEQRAGRARYRWFPGLGNAAVGTGEGPMRLVTPADAYELLGLALAQRRQRRRVVFFCSCGSPFSARTCHRQLVRRALLSSARSIGVKASVQEWPGGPLRERVLAELPVREESLESLLGGAQALRLGRELPHVRFLAWPAGGLLRLRYRDRSQLVSVAAARFHAGEWKMPLYVHPVEEGDSAERLLHHARRFRREGMLEEFRVG